MPLVWGNPESRFYFETNRDSGFNFLSPKEGEKKTAPERRLV